MRNLSVLLLALLWGSLQLMAADAAGALARPNIVLIVADDLGWGETGAQGGDIPTPHLDSIAHAGVRFTCGYVTAPVGSPSRAGLMTGRYPQRFGYELNPPPGRRTDGGGLPRAEQTIANHLRALGYCTGLIGKWHLGDRPGFHPLDRGFDEFFGFTGGTHRCVPRRKNRDNTLQRARQPVADPSCLTEAIGHEAVAFVERHQQQPFFLCVAFNAVHAPLEAPDEALARHAHLPDPRRRTFAAMLDTMDLAVGSLLETLRATGLENNTLLIFVSDNGGPTRQTTSSNGPLRGCKGNLYEGGIRVPFFLQWKARVAAGQTFNLPVSTLDILPTCLAAAGGKLEADSNLDGVNLLPFLTKQSSATPHQRLFWRFGSKWAVREGDWKLVSERPGDPQLFHLATDIAEKKDLAAQELKVVRELHAAFEQWNQQLQEPSRPTRKPASSPLRTKPRNKKGGRNPNATAI